MSYQAMDWAFEQECRDAIGKLVLVAIAKHADEKGQCFPSASRIALLANTTRRTVHRKINELKEDGLIAVKARGKDGKKTSNLYTLCIGTQRPIHRDTASHRINKTNKSDNTSSINGTGGHMVDWTAMGAAALGVERKEND